MRKINLLLCAALAAAILGPVAPARAAWVFDRHLLSTLEESSQGDDVLIAGDRAFIADSDASPMQRGIVNVYRRVGSGATSSWEPIATVTSPEPGEEHFGARLAYSNGTLVVGAPRMDQDWRGESGAVFVFAENGNTYTHTATLRSASLQRLRRFGEAVAIDGDILAVGAPRDALAPEGWSDHLPEYGAVSIYHLIDGTWTLAQVVGGTLSSRFGSAVEISTPNIYVGAPGFDRDRGKVIELVPSLNPNESPYIERLSWVGGTGSRLGTSLAIDGNRMVAGGTGVAAVLERASQGDSFQIASSLPIEPAYAATFGAAVAVSGNKIAVGVPDSGRVDPGGGPPWYGYGEIDVFTKRSTGWVRTAILTRSDARDLGASLAMSGRMILSGGNYADRSPRQRGAYSFVDKDGTRPTITWSPAPPSFTNQTSVQYGFTVSDNETPTADLIVECAVDSGAWVPCTSPRTATGLTTEGPHVVWIRAQDEAGNVAHESRSVIVDFTRPGISGAGSPLPNGHGWNNTPVTVTWSCSDALSGIATCPAPTVVSVDTAGTTAQANAMDKAGNVATGSFGPIRIDRVKPAITRVVHPAPTAAGWNNTNVTVGYTCSDTLSGVQSCPGTDVVTATGTTTIVSGEASDKAGNVNTLSSTIKIDRTPPSIRVMSVTPAAEPSGWHRSAPVTVRWACSDGESGPVATEVTAQANANDEVVTGECFDNAGNKTRNHVPVRIDLATPFGLVMGDESGFEELDYDGILEGVATDNRSGVTAVWIEARQRDNEIPALLGFTQYERYSVAVEPCASPCTFTRWSFDLRQVGTQPDARSGLYDVRFFVQDEAGWIYSSPEHRILWAGSPAELPTASAVRPNVIA